jgi:sec-independent protein translocase protein TatB
MFDIGFQEVMVIGVIALVVVGPHRLPKLAKTAGLYLGRVRRIVGEVRADVENELRTEEVKRAIEEYVPVDDIYDAVDEAKSSFLGAKDTLESAARDSMDEAKDALSDPDASAATADESDADKDGAAQIEDDGSAAPPVVTDAFDPADFGTPATVGPNAATVDAESDADLATPDDSLPGDDDKTVMNENRPVV